ncbi:MAG: PAS domain S-box protein [Vulcanimicrobiota bacterium]
MKFFSVLAVDGPEDLERWPIFLDIEVRRVPDWDGALELLECRHYDYLVVADERLPETHLDWLPRSIPLSLLDPIKNLQAQGLLQNWIEQALSNQRMRQEQDRLRQQGELRWQTAGEEFGQLFQSSPLGMMLVSTKGQILRVNQRAGMLLGRALNEIENIPLTAFVPAEDIDALLSRLWACLRGEKPVWKLRLRHLEGKEKVIQAQAQMVPATRTIQICLNDLSREIEIQEEMAGVQGDLQALLHSLADGVLISDQNCRVLSSNVAAQQMLGFSPEEMEGRFWQELGLKLDLDATGPTVSWFTSQQGKSHLFECRHTLRRDSGHLRRLLILRDLSPFRQARQELDELRERERAAVGQELHDDLGQLLTALSYLAEMVSGRVQVAGDQTTVEMASQIARLAKQSIGKTRALARGLYPVVLERSGLVEALRDLASTTEEYYRLPCRVRAAQVELDRRLGLHLFRIAQEAVTNAVKHSRCRTLDIIVQADQSRVWLEVRDDGIGLDASNVASRNGVGLRSMRQHAELMEGGLEVDSSPGEGTSVCCWGPRNPRNAP